MFIDRDYNPIPAVGYYEALEVSYRRSINTARDIKVPQPLLNMTLNSFGEMCCVCPETAYECFLVTEVALDKLEILQSIFPNIQVSYEHTYATSLLHDIGKLVVPRYILRASEQGGDKWKHAEMYPRMTTHSILGANLLQSRGFPVGVYQPVLENHAKQRSSLEYGGGTLLDYRPRTTRDCVSTADFDIACLMRNNNRNAELNLEERVALCLENNAYVFGDYTKSDEIVAQIEKIRFKTSLEAI